MDFNGFKISKRIIASTAFQYGCGYDFLENPWAWIWRKLGLMTLDDFDAFITPTITTIERQGFYKSKLKFWRVIRIYPHKILNRFGWNNCGIVKLTTQELPKLGKNIKKCIVSIGALHDINEILAMIEELNSFNILAIEINISCHNVNLCFLENKKILRELFRKAHALSRHPLIVKINAESDYLAIAKIAQEEGIDLIHAINTMRVYSKELKGYCGQSSYKNKETALRIITELRKNGIAIPIIGGSGIWNKKDIKNYMKAGANLFSMSHQFIYFPFWPGILSRKIKYINKTIPT